MGIFRKIDAIYKDVKEIKSLMTVETEYYKDLTACQEKKLSEITDKYKKVCQELKDLTTTKKTTKRTIKKQVEENV